MAHHAGKAVLRTGIRTIVTLCLLSFAVKCALTLLNVSFALGAWHGLEGYESTAQAAGHMQALAFAGFCAVQVVGGLLLPRLAADLGLARPGGRSPRQAVAAAVLAIGAFTLLSLFGVGIYVCFHVWL